MGFIHNEGHVVHPVLTLWKRATDKFLVGMGDLLPDWDNFPSPPRLGLRKTLTIAAGPSWLSTSKRE